MEVDSVCSTAENLNKDLLLQLLNSESPEEKLQSAPVFHAIVKGLQNQPDSHIVGEQMIYLFSIHGFDVNTYDQTGRIALLSYLQDADRLSLGVIQAFCRCGSDLLKQDETGMDCVNYILTSASVQRSEKEMIMQFVPGLWKAVESDDAMSVRRLINQWCTVRVAKHGMSVIELAFSKGTENIIRVISGIGPSMDLAHGVIAGDIQYVKRLLQSGKKFNVNLKNLSDEGATPLFYAMCSNDVAMVDVLMENGARLDISMHGDTEDIPLYFSALSHQPKICSDLLCHTIPTTPVPVEQLFYKGRNVLFHCVDAAVDVRVFEKILRQSSARLITQRLQDNLDVREYAEKVGRLCYVNIIDQVVTDWCLNCDTNKNRKILVLHDYPLLSSILVSQVTDDSETNISSDTHTLSTFLENLEDYKLDIKNVVEAVEDGDLLRVKEELYSKSGSSKGFESCLADARLKGDGQPLLHKAVLRRETKITQILAETLVYVRKQKLDTIRDQYFRTALHYAYGMEDGNQLISILEDLGSSEFAMDKDCRSPLAFKDRRSQTEMKDLLQYQLLQVLDKEEPDPWSVPLPLPIMGYISKCLHSHHGTREIRAGNHITDSAEKLLAISEKSEEDSSEGQEREHKHSDKNLLQEKWENEKMESVSWMNLCKSKSASDFDELNSMSESADRTSDYDGESEASTCSREQQSNREDTEYEADYSEVSSIESYNSSNRSCAIL